VRLGEKVRAFLELSRISNVPTVISNAFAGSAVGALAIGNTSLSAVAGNGTVVAAACSLFYIAGMALNDLADREIDRAERPSRPIPSGRVTPEAAFGYACVLIVAGLSLLLLVDAAALITGGVLVALVLAYDLLHTRTRWSVLLMGACRGAVVVAGALAFGMPSQPIVVMLPAALLLLYVAAFSLVARHEADLLTPKPKEECPRCSYPARTASERCPECGTDFLPKPPTADDLRRRAVFGRLLGGLPLLSAVLLHSAFTPARPPSAMDILIIVLLIATIGFLLAWTTAAARLVEQTPPKIGPAVTMWIAGISIADAYLALLCRSPSVACLCIACFFLTRAGQRRIAGT
jgi:4-hydroxybenzoate polyprenyltransferase